MKEFSQGLRRKGKRVKGEIKGKIKRNGRMQILRRRFCGGHGIERKERKGFWRHGTEKGTTKVSGREG